MTREEYEEELSKASNQYEAILTKNRYIESLERTIRLKESYIQSIKYEMVKKDTV